MTFVNIIMVGMNGGGHVANHLRHDRLCLCLSVWLSTRTLNLSQNLFILFPCSHPHTYPHTYIYTRTHTHAHIHTRTHTHKARAHTRRHTHARTHARTHTQTHTHTHTCKHTHARTQTHMCARHKYLLQFEQYTRCQTFARI